MDQQMTYQEAVAILRNHSNLDRGADQRSLLYSLWHANQQGNPPDLQGHVEEIVACLGAANLEMNGARPSETIDRENREVMFDLAYAVSGLVVGLLQHYRRWSATGRFPASVSDELRDAALRIAMAWDMVLAGDHDNLEEELRIEWDAAV